MALQTHSLSTLIGNLSQSPAKPGDRIGIVQHVTETAHTLFSADVSVMFAINPSTTRLLAPAGVAGVLHTSDPASLDLPRLDGITAQVLRCGVLTIADLEQHPEFHSTFKRREGIRSFAAVALYTRQRSPLAVLYLNFRQERQFSSEDLDLLQLFVAQASLVLQHTRALRRYHEVARIGHEINQELDTAEVLFQNLLAHVGGILDITHGFMLAVHEPQTHSLHVFLTDDCQYHSIPNQDIADLRGCQWVIHHQQPLVIHHYSEEVAELPVQLSNVAGTEAKVFESLVFLPLTFRGMPLGVLSLQHLRPHAYDEEDLHILELLGNHIALALSNIRLYNNVRWLNETGQVLTRQLDSERVLQDVVDRIRAATKADLVILHSYIAASQLFDPLLRVSGELRASRPSRPGIPRPDDMALLIVQRNQPVFAKDSSRLFEALSGDPQTRKGRFEQREQIRSTAAVPLCVGEEAVGGLFVNFRQPQRFDGAQNLLIEGLASYAAIAIKNSREFDTLAQRRVRELEALQQIDHQINKTLDLHTVLQTIVTLSTESIHTFKASIFLYDAHRQVLETKAFFSPEDPAYYQSLVIPLHEKRGLVWWAFEHKRPIRVNNVQTDPEWHKLYIPVASDILSEMDVPLLDGEEVIGVINFEHKQAAAFSQADEDFVVTLAGQAVLAIKNAQAYAREQRLAREKQTLIEIDKEISKTLDLQQVMQKILDLAAVHIPSDAASILLYNPRTQTLQMKAAIGTHAAVNQIFELPVYQDKGITSWVFKHKTPVRIGNVSSDPKWHAMYAEASRSIRSEMDVPLLDGGEVVGVINFESRREAAFSQEDEDFLVALAQQAVLAIKNAQAYERAERGKSQLRALHEVDQAIIGQLDRYEQVIHAILENALKLTNVEAADLDLYDNGTASATYFARHYQGQLSFEHIDATDPALFQVPRGIVARVAETHQSYRTLHDAQEDPYYVGRMDTHSEVAVPLLAGDRLIGVLNLESRQRYAFDEEDVEVLELFAGQAVIAIQNATSYDRAERNLLRFRLLHHAGQQLGGIADLSQIDYAYTVVTQTILEHSSSQIIIRRYDAATQELVLAHCANIQGELPVERKSPDTGLNWQVMRERRTIVVPDVQHPPADVYGRTTDPWTRSRVIVPILFEGHYYGNLGLSHGQVNYFRDTDVELFEGLAYQLAITIYRLEAAQAYQDAEKRLGEARVMSSIGQSALGLAHRLGNDLGLVKTTVNNIRLELAAQGIDNAAIHQDLDRIVQDVRRVLDLSTRLKAELSDFRAEQPPRDPVVIPFNILLKQIAPTFPTIPENIEVQREGHENPARVRIIPGDFAEIVYNLVKNALEAMPNGGRLTLRVRSGSRYIELQVIDTGVGIPPSKQAQIFNLFYSTKGSFGFGLWSARRNALAHGGDVTVMSVVGQGTTFTLTLPLIDEYESTS